MNRHDAMQKLLYNIPVLVSSMGHRPSEGLLITWTDEEYAVFQMITVGNSIQSKTGKAEIISKFVPDRVSPHVFWENLSKVSRIVCGVPYAR